MIRKVLMFLLALAAVLVPLCACRMRRNYRLSRSPENLGELCWDRYPPCEAVVYLPETPERWEAGEVWNADSSWNAAAAQDADGLWNPAAEWDGGGLRFGAEPGPGEAFLSEKESGPEEDFPGGMESGGGEGVDAGGERPGKRELPSAAVRYAPFLVLTDRSGGVLLLRQYILPEAVRFNDYNAYYADSEIDRYLNGRYLSRLSALPVPILDTEVSVTTEASLGITGTETEDITRKVFLLSCTELCGDGILNTGREGTPLRYFRGGEHRAALGEDGKPSGWWLRSPDTYYLSCPFGVGPDGSIGSGNAYNRNGVRPAFRLAADLPLEVREDIVPGERVFVLASDALADG